MTRADRRAAVAAYRERKPQGGIYALRCGPTGQVWLGRSQRLDAQRNAVGFQLRHGGVASPSLRAACRAHGPGAFTFETLEEAPQDLTPLGLTDLLKRRLAHWREVLGADLI